MKSITGNIVVDYLKGSSSYGVIYEDGKFSSFLMDGEEKSLLDILTDIKKFIYEDAMDSANILLKTYKPLIFASGDDNLIEYYHSIQFEYFYWKHSSKESEFKYQKLFKDKVEILYPEYKLTTMKHNPEHIPDAWVEKSGEKIPVEVKLRSFDKAALRQLERYIEAFKTKEGIAVARDVTVELPENIRFISLEELE